MKRMTYTDSILKFIADHPGCQYSEIISGTGIDKSNVSSVLTKLVYDQRLARSGARTGYKYTVTGSRRMIPSLSDSQGGESTFGCANPLTSLFNQCLMQVRANQTQGRPL